MIGMLRRISYRYPARYAAMNRVKISYGKYACNLCRGVFSRKDTQVDHIEPVVGVKGFVDWNTYIARLFPEESGYQVLCKPCHQVKSQGENKIRRNVKKRTVQKVDRKTKKRS